jgi:hypothetical protein
MAWPVGSAASLPGGARLTSDPASVQAHETQRTPQCRRQLPNAPAARSGRPHRSRIPRAAARSPLGPAAVAARVVLALPSLLSSTTPSSVICCAGLLRRRAAAVGGWWCFGFFLVLFVFCSFFFSVFRPTSVSGLVVDLVHPRWGCEVNGQTRPPSLVGRAPRPESDSGDDSGTNSGPARAVRRP